MRRRPLCSAPLQTALGLRLITAIPAITLRWTAPPASLTLACWGGMTAIPSPSRSVPYHPTSSQVGVSLTYCG